MRPVVIETTTGAFFDFSRATDPSQINLEDIATALSNTCRFGGHVSRFYSVAEHSVRVSRRVFQRTDSRMLTLAALHHDSHEAYIGDIPTPLKALWGEGLKTMAGNIDQAIADKFGILPEWMHMPSVVEADAWMLRVEAGQLKPSRGVGDHWGQDAPIQVRETLGWDPARARIEFIGQHKRLAGWTD